MRKSFRGPLTKQNQGRKRNARKALTFAFHSPTVRPVEETGDGSASCKTGSGVSLWPLFRGQGKAATGSIAFYWLSRAGCRPLQLPSRKRVRGRSRESDRLIPEAG